MVKVKLMFQTDGGYESLIEHVEASFSSEDELAAVASKEAQRYFDNNKAIAEQRMNGWQMAGKDVEMWPVCECEDEQVAKAFNDAFDAMGV